MSTVAGERRRIYPGLDQVVVRSLVLLGAMTTLVAVQAAGSRPALWVQLVVTGLAVLLAVRPDSSGGAVLLVGVAYLWATVPDPLSPLVLLAAGGLVLAHVAALVAGQGPASMRVDPRQAGLWLARGVLLWLAAAAVWGLTWLADGWPAGRLAYAAGLTALLLLAAATTWLLVPRR
jgi:hypothetical protein